jgi:hypothetical protein
MEIKVEEPPVMNSNEDESRITTTMIYSNFNGDQWRSK